MVRKTPKAAVAGPSDDDGSRLSVRFSIERVAEIDHAFTIEGAILYSPPDDDDGAEEPRRIGSLRALVVSRVEDWQDVIRTADDISASALRLTELDVEPLEMIQQWLGIEAIEIDEKWRKRCLSFLAMQELLRLFPGPFTLVTCRADPSIGKRIANDEDEDTSYAEEQDPRVIANGEQKLADYCRRFGLQPAEGGLFYQHLGVAWSEGSWMATVDA